MRTRNLMLLILAAGFGLPVACSDASSTDDPWEELGGGSPTGMTTSSTSSNTTSSTSTTSSSTSTTSSTGGTGGTGGSGGTGGTGGTGGCDDTGPGEPANDTESGAYDLGVLPDNDPNPLPTLDGVIDGPGDEDWYTYQGDDDVGFWVDPWRSRGSDLGLRICAYFECLDGTTEIGGGSQIGQGGGSGDPVECPDGTVPDLSDQGRIGCCTEPPQIEMDIDLNCPDASWDDDSANVYIRIDAPGASAGVCTTYGVEYHF